MTKLSKIVWKTQGRKKIFQVGDFDRKALGFKYSGLPYQHSMVSKCPANLTYIVGKIRTSDWCLGQYTAGSGT